MHIMHRAYRLSLKRNDPKLEPTSPQTPLLTALPVSQPKSRCKCVPLPTQRVADAARATSAECRVQSAECSAAGVSASPVDDAPRTTATLIMHCGPAGLCSAEVIPCWFGC